jgi:hypothetical protein
LATTMQTVENILKEVYEDRLRDQLQSETITLLRIERTSEGISEDVGGKFVVFPIRTRRNHGIGARAELSPLPTPRTQTYRRAELLLKYLYGSILLTGQTMKLAETKPQSFTSTLNAEINGLKEGLKKDTNRQVYGSSKGVLAVATGGTTTTMTTANAQYLEEGMWVDIHNGADDSLQDAEVEITSIVETTPGTWTVTFDRTVTSVGSGDFLVRTGNLNLEKTGFDDIIVGPNGDGTGPLYGITDSVWTSNVENVNGALSEGVMISMVNRIRRRGGMPSVGFCSLGVQTAYFELLVGQRRYTNTTEFAGGFKGLAFTVDGRDIPIVADFDCQSGRLYFVDESEIKLYQADDWSWLDKGGSMWERHQDSNGRYDAWLADLHKYCEIGTHRRNAHGALLNISEVL